MHDAIKTAETVYNWLREPDWAEQWNIYDWATRRPVAEIRAIQAELSRLKSPLGDEGKALVNTLNAMGDPMSTLAAAYIEHQAAALTVERDKVAKLREFIARTFAFGIRSDGWDAGAAHDLKQWLVGGMKGDMPVYHKIWEPEVSNARALLPVTGDDAEGSV